MYLVGTPHPLRAASELIVTRFAHEGKRLVTDAEVLQEVIHRFAAIDRRHAIAEAFDVLLSIVYRVLPIEQHDVVRAADIVRHRARLSARDALHVAIMERYGIDSILSFDADFDRWPGITRVLCLTKKKPGGSLPRAPTRFTSSN